MVRLIWTILSLVLGLAPAAGATAPTSVRESLRNFKEPSEMPLWLAGVNYGVSTDIADEAAPRLYYQGVNGFLSRRFTPLWSVSLGLAATFTTMDGQVDKKQEDTVVEAAGVSPSIGLNYAGVTGSPWIFGVSGTALLDPASQREGYGGILSGNFGGSWRFWGDRFDMTHSLGISEILNTYEYSSEGTPNPGTAITYSWSNSLALGEYFTLSAGFGLKRTRYLDGFWDYAYNTWVRAAVNMDGWIVSLATSNGGYTDDGRVALWYIDRYRRIVSLSLAYNF